MELGSGSEGRRRGGGQHMKCADRQMEELTEDKQTPCSHSVRHLRQAQSTHFPESPLTSSSSSRKARESRSPKRSNGGAKIPHASDRTPLRCQEILSTGT